MISAIGGDQQDNLVILMGINTGTISWTDGVDAFGQIYVTFTIRIEFLTWDILF